MAKYELRVKARQLRSRGESVKVIAKTLGVSKSTGSLWVRDIILTVEQLQNLKERELKGAELGRIRGAFVQKERRLKKIEDGKKEAIVEIGELSRREFFVAGVGLYWAEGAKKRGTVQFFNSDPKMIKLMILWFKIFFGVKNCEFRARVGVNEAHREREIEIKEYWSKITGIPLSQFTQTSLKKVRNQKIFDNFNEHFGTLSIYILKPTRFYYKIMGLIEGLSEAGCRLASQGVS